MTVIDGTYAFSKQITISSGTALSNYQLKFTVNRSEGVDSGLTVYVGEKCQTDYDDIRFTNSAGTILDCWVESSSSSTATIWVEVDTIANGSTTIFIYYGNPDATSVSNGTNTFVFFDDFSGAGVDTSLWTVNGSPTTSSSILTVPYRAYIASKTTFGLNYALRGRSKIGHPTSNYGTLGFYNAGTWSKGAVWVGVNGSTAFQTINKNTSSNATNVTLTDDYHLFDVCRLADVNNYYSDGTLKKADTSYVASDSLNIVIGEDSSGSHLCDWVLIRQYTTTEPTIASWGSENTRSGVGFGTVNMMMVG